MSKKLGILYPVIIACTSEIIDSALENKIKDVGFNGVYEAPIKDTSIKFEIIP